MTLMEQVKMDQVKMDHEMRDSTIKVVEQVDKQQQQQRPRKLDFRKMAFFGRCEELAALEHAYANVLSASAIKSEQAAAATATFVWGLSGSGKSALVHRFAEQQQDDSNDSNDSKPYFVEGKYTDSVSQASDPFSAIVQAFDSFCDQASNDNTERLRIRDAVKKALGNDVHTISKLVPSIRRLLSDSTEVQSTTATDDADAQHATDTAWNRLQYAFVKFIQAISTQERPVILFLDDLQWASEASLDLLSTLLANKNLKHFMLLGTIRQELDPHTNQIMEMETTSPLSKMLRTLQGLDDAHNNSSTSIAWNDITLSNLTSHDIGSWLSQLLDRTVEDLESLTSKVHAKTEGNTFFTIQLVEQLERSKILTFNNGRWEWPDQEHIHLDDDCNVANSVIQLLSIKLKQLSPELRTSLIVAAYIRFSFDISTLMAVLKAEEPEQDFDVPALLEEAVLDGLLTNSIGGTVYQFAHDRIQQAARELVPVGEKRDALRYRIGQTLINICQTKDATQNRDLMFVATDHLNFACKDDHLYLVNLNLQVAELALSMVALAQAGEYFRFACEHLQNVSDDPWQSHYDLALRLYKQRADVELSLGHYDHGYELGEMVLEGARSLDDKLPMYVSMASALGRQDRHLESLEMSRKGAQLLDQYPKRNFLARAARGMLKVKTLMKKTHADDLLALPLMTDKRDLLAMKFMTQIIIRSFVCQKMVDYVLAVLGCIELSLKQGLCEETAMAFASYGLLISGLGDHANASRLAKLADLVMKKTEGKALAGLVHIICSLYIRSWDQFALPFIDGFRTSFATNMEMGDFESGFFCWATCNVLAFFEGYQLDALDRSNQELLDQMVLYKITSVTDWMSQYAQSTSILTGREPLDWDSVKNFGEGVPRDASNFQYLRIGYQTRLYLSIHFGQYEIAECLFGRLDSFATDDPSYHSVSPRLMALGLMAAGRYRQTKKLKYIYLLRKLRRQSKKICKDRGIANTNRFLILEAALFSVTKNKTQTHHVVQAYNAAIAASVNYGHLHEAALASELAGDLMLSTNWCSESMVEYYSQAFEYYKRYGARAKMDDLKARRGAHIDENLFHTVNSSDANEDKLISGVPGDEDGLNIRRKVMKKKRLLQCESPLRYSLIYATGVATNQPEAMSINSENNETQTLKTFAVVDTDDDISRLTDK